MCVRFVSGWDFCFSILSYFRGSFVLSATINAAARTITIRSHLMAKVGHERFGFEKILKKRKLINSNDFRSEAIGILLYPHRIALHAR